MPDTKTTGLSEITSPALTDDVYIAATPGGTPASKRCTIGNLRTAMSTPVEGAWTDYGATSTIVGFASITNKVIRYKQIGKIVFVIFYIDGTSNATNFTFTLPVASSASATSTEQPVRVQDAGSFQATAGLLDLPANSNVVTLYKTLPGGAWTSTATTKGALGQFFYEVA